VKRDHYTFLDENGLPGWIVIGALLEGEKKSLERGELLWEIAETSLPSLFVFGENNEENFSGQMQIHSPR
jgi:hypothetical protein